MLGGINDPRDKRYITYFGGRQINENCLERHYGKDNDSKDEIVN